MGSDEIKLLAIIAAGTKRTSKKRTISILKVAKAFKDLHDLHGSLDAVSKIVKLSPEMIRQDISNLKKNVSYFQILLRKVNQLD